jgi:hypothetical protein
MASKSADPAGVNSRRVQATTMRTTTKRAS